MSLTTSALLLSRFYALPIDVANLVVAYAVDDKQLWVPVFNATNARLMRRLVNPCAYRCINDILEVRSFGQSFLGPLHAVIYNGIRIEQCRWGLTAYRSIARSDSASFVVSLYAIIELPSGMRDYLAISCVYSLVGCLGGLIRGTVYRPYLDEELPITSFQYKNNVMLVDFLDIHGEWELDPNLNIFDFDVHTPNIWD